MKPCCKVKNPCKICIESVNKKNGLQCRGACKQWFHYKCLNYTPGKISDVKAGIIKVSCPCPDCDTVEPKEVLANPPYPCRVPKCPATDPSCDLENCPNKVVIPSCEPKPTSPKCPSPPMSPKCSVSIKMTCPTECPSDTDSPSPSPRNQENCRERSPTQPKKSCPYCEAHCHNARPLCAPQKSKSCSIITSKISKSGDSCNPPRASSQSCLTESQRSQKMVFTTIEDMFNTVGELTNQLKDLMCRMMNAFETKNCNRS